MFEEEDLTFSTLLEEIKIHENFSRSSLENNIAIGYVSHEMFMLIMKKVIMFTAYVLNFSAFLKACVLDQGELKWLDSVVMT
jgi:hypothetical protein